MSESTQTEPATPTLTGWCHWHKGAGGDAVAVEAIEGGSGPGYTLYACARCREKNGLVPLAQQA
ncbi:hypothetical protein [Streptomyces griseoluteus]|uniref:hypothetical protein n=1 Tax=Streptomyces griseoluteus TaxID=29306 RepID=UPI003653C27C